MSGVLAWPEERQQEFLAIVEDIEAGMDGQESIELTPEDLAVLDERIADADAGNFATAEEVEAVLAKMRRT